MRLITLHLFLIFADIHIFQYNEFLTKYIQSLTSHELLVSWDVGKVWVEVV